MGKKYIVDTDIGDDVDDTLALLYALRSGIDVIGITTVFRDAEYRAVLAKKLLSLAGKEIPVFAGESTPLTGFIPASAPSHVLGGSERNNPDFQPDVCGEGNSAVNFIVSSAERYGEDLVIVGIGPFTNLALAMQKSDAVKKARVVIMGGAYYTQYVDWNVYCDVAAADVLFQNAERLTCVGADVTHELAVPENVLNGFMDSKNEDAFTAQVKEYVKAWKRAFGEENSVYLHDPLAMSVALGEPFVKTENVSVRVITEGTLAGLTVNETAVLKAGAPTGNVHTVCKAVDEKGFIEAFFKRISC